MNETRIITANANETLKLAKTIGSKLKGGEILELVSDMGGGKTTFVRGLSQGLGSRDHVHSPSFTLSNVYKSNAGMTLHHYDFHRLNEPGIMREELAEIMEDPSNVVVIEWADIVKDVLPELRLTIGIKVTGENTREFDFSYPEQLKYLIPEEL